MKCPLCEVELVMADRQGVEIDYCPQCRGVWLDRGELDKIIEKNQASCAPAMRQSSYDNAPRPSFGNNDRHYEEHDKHDEYNSHGNYDSRYGQQKKKGGLLGEIFDF